MGHLKIKPQHFLGLKGSKCPEIWVVKPLIAWLYDYRLVMVHVRKKGEDLLNFRLLLLWRKEKIYQSLDFSCCGERRRSTKF